MSNVDGKKEKGEEGDRWKGGGIPVGKLTRGG